MAYPTPPQTSSPKQHSSFDAQAQEAYNNTPSQNHYAQDPVISQLQQYHPQYQQQPYDAQTPFPNQPIHPQTFPQPYQQPFDASKISQDPNSYTQPYQHPYETPKVSAQDSYYHSHSAPSSPTLAQPPLTSAKPPIVPSSPRRRRSSPIPSPLHQSSRLGSPLIRPNSSGSQHRQRSPGNPNYYSNSPIPFSLSPKPTPYNLNRPQKRPGFFARCWNKIKAWMGSFARWTKRNPVKMGLLTFFPVMTIAGIAKVARGIGKGLGLVKKGTGRPKPDRVESSRNVDGEGKRNVRWEEDETDVQEAEGWGWGLGDFKGFAGSKGGRVDGLLKIVHMLVNHWCKLTPSSIPRLTSIILELYFLDKAK